MCSEPLDWTSWGRSEKSRVAGALPDMIPPAFSVRAMKTLQNCVVLTGAEPPMHLAARERRSALQCLPTLPTPLDLDLREGWASPHLPPGTPVG